MEHVSTYNKSYLTTEEFEARKTLFAAVDAEIREHNATDSLYELGHNRFSDWTEFERNRIKGHKVNPNVEVKELELDANTVTPTSWDWRDHNAVTAVKDQGDCGSCWTFSATGALEGAHAIKSGSLETFSEQVVVDCFYKRESGCDGGDEVEAMQYFEKHYIMHEKDYPYTGKKGKCEYDADKATKIETTSTHGGGRDRPNSMRSALHQHGPMTVAIQADIMHYKKGIFDNERCGCDMDHAVLLVGYGEENGTEYWIVKNSWAADWGEDGYIRFAIEKGRGICCVQDYPHYPEVNM